MPRYFFNVHDGKAIEDTEGTVLLSEAHAREQAIITAAEMLRSEAATLQSNEVWEMKVTDEAGHCMLTLRFSADDHLATV
jgi:hypothetical protein